MQIPAHCTRLAVSRPARTNSSPFLKHDPLPHSLVSVQPSETICAVIHREDGTKVAPAVAEVDAALLWLAALLVGSALVDHPRFQEIPHV